MVYGRLVKRPSLSMSLQLGDAKDCCWEGSEVGCRLNGFICICCSSPSLYPSDVVSIVMAASIPFCNIPLHLHITHIAKCTIQYIFNSLFCMPHCSVTLCCSMVVFSAHHLQWIDPYTNYLLTSLVSILAMSSHKHWKLSHNQFLDVIAEGGNSDASESSSTGSYISEKQFSDEDVAECVPVAQGLRCLHINLFLPIDCSDHPVLTPDQEQEQLQSLAADFVCQYGSLLLDEQPKDKENTLPETGLRDIVWSGLVQQSQDALFSFVRLWGA